MNDMPPPGMIYVNAPPMVRTALDSCTARVSLIGNFVTPALALPPLPPVYMAETREGSQDSLMALRANLALSVMGMLTSPPWLSTLNMAPFWPVVSAMRMVMPSLAMVISTESTLFCGFVTEVEPHPCP